jgi:hypothetical protein
MPLTLDFPGKAEHPGYLALEDPSRVTVTLTSDDGSPVRDPWLVQAWFVTGRERTLVEPKGSSGATAHYQLVPRPGAPPLAWFEVEAAEQASERVLKTRLCVLSPLGEGLRTAAWWALGIAALYTVVVLPEAPRLVSRVQAVPSFLGLGGGAVVVGFGVSYLKKLPRVDPRKLLIAGALAVAWMLFIWSSVTFVINDSLDPIPVEGARCQEWGSSATLPTSSRRCRWVARATTSVTASPGSRRRWSCRGCRGRRVSRGRRPCRFRAT